MFAILFVLLFLIVICVCGYFSKISHGRKITRCGSIWSRRRAAQNLIAHSRINWKRELQETLTQQRSIKCSAPRGQWHRFRGGVAEDSGRCDDTESSYSSLFLNFSDTEGSKQISPNNIPKMAQRNARRDPKKKIMRNQQRDKNKRRKENEQRNKQKKKSRESSDEILAIPH